jgi:hypothetical protein
LDEVFLKFGFQHIPRFVVVVNSTVQQNGRSAHVPFDVPGIEVDFVGGSSKLLFFPLFHGEGFKFAHARGFKVMSESCKRKNDFETAILAVKKIGHC